MNENPGNVPSPTDGEILARLQIRLAAIEPLIAPPPAWRPEVPAPSMGGRRDRLNARVRPRAAAGYGAAAAVALVAIIVAASFATQGPRNPGTSGESPTAFVPVTTIVYQLVTPAGVEPTAAELETTVQILEDRAWSVGDSNLRATAQPPDRVSTSFAGVVNAAALESLLGQTGNLEFVLLPPAVYGTAGSPGTKQVPADGETIDRALPAQFTGSDLDPSGYALSTDPGGPGYLVDFAFKPAAAAEFATWSGEHANDYFAIVLDGKVLSAPYIYSQIDGGRGEISGVRTAESADDLVTILRAGPLPFPLRQISSSTSTPGPLTAGGPTPPAAGPSSLTIGKTTSGPLSIITYRLVPRSGGEPTSAELERTATMLAYRLASIFPTLSWPDASGSPMPDLTQAQGFSVTVAAPDRVVVRFESDFRVDDALSFVWDASSIRKWLGRTGSLEFVELPPGVYGTGGSPGPKPLPTAGAAIDPSLAPLLTRSDIASLSGGFSSASGPLLRCDFTEAGAATMAHYSDTSTGHYLALTLDGIVLGTTEMAGQDRFGTLQMTSVSEDDLVVLGWLLEAGNSPLPVPLVEVSFSTTAPSGSTAPRSPRGLPTPIPLQTPIAPPTPILSPTPGTS